MALTLSEKEIRGLAMYAGNPVEVWFEDGQYVKHTLTYNIINALQEGKHKPINQLRVQLIHIGRLTIEDLTKALEGTRYTRSMVALIDRRHTGEVSFGIDMQRYTFGRMSGITRGGNNGEMPSEMIGLMINLAGMGYYFGRILPGHLVSASARRDAPEERELDLHDLLF